MSFPHKARPTDTHPDRPSAKDRRMSAANTSASCPPRTVDGAPCLRVPDLPTSLPLRVGAESWCLASGRRVQGGLPNEVQSVVHDVRERMGALRDDRAAWDVVVNKTAAMAGFPRWSSLAGSWIGLDENDEWRAMARGAPRRWAGIVFVGDSQVREVAWGMHWLLRRANGWLPPKFHSDTEKQKHYSHLLNSGCTPEFLGRLGFVVACSSDDALAGRGAPCTVHRTDTDGVSVEHAFMPLTNTSFWDHNLTVLREGQKRAALLCNPTNRTFFVAYQPIWGSAPLDPASLPSCYHLGNGRFGRRAPDGSVRPILWVVNGGALHEFSRSHKADGLAERALSHFAPHTLRHDIVWQPGGGTVANPAHAAWSAALKQARRNAALKGAPPLPANFSDNAPPAALLYERVPPDDVGWLRAHGVRWFNYTRLSAETAVRRAPLHLLLGGVLAGLPTDDGGDRARRATRRARQADEYVHRRVMMMRR